MSIAKIDDIQNSAGTAGPTFSKGINQSGTLTSQSGSFAFTSTDGILTLLCTGSGAQAITLPAASAVRNLRIFKTASSGSVTITRSGSDTIDGATSYTLGSQYEKVELIADGSTLWTGYSKTPNAEHFVNNNSAAANGMGSTNTKIRYFGNIVSSAGTGITYAASSVSGDSWTINEAGVYTMSVWDAFVGQATMGISLNATGAELTTSIGGIGAKALIAVDSGGSSTSQGASVTKRLVVGDVIRAHYASAAVSSNTNVEGFRITQVARF